MISSRKAINKPVKHQIIREGGKPLFVLVPYDIYVKNMSRLEADSDDETTIPHEVVKLSVIDGKSPVRAWREFKKLSQKEIARRLGVSQSAYSQMEKPDAKPRDATLEKIADALGIDPRQLDF